MSLFQFVDEVGCDEDRELSRLGLVLEIDGGVGGSRERPTVIVLPWIALIRRSVPSRHDAGQRSGRRNPGVRSRPS